MIPEPQFCAQCGTALITDTPPLDDRPRRLCPRCGHVAYVNPKLAAGTVPVRDGHVALIRRGVPPRVGFWSWPCGYVEIDETIETCAVRETREECGLTVELGPMLGLFSYPRIEPPGPADPALREGALGGFVIACFATTSAEGSIVAGDDATEAEWFPLDAVPWDLLAFRSSHDGLRALLASLGG